MIRKISLVIYNLLLILALLSCEQSDEGTVEQEKEVIANYTIEKGDKMAIADVSPVFKDVLSINLSGDVAAKIGNYSSFFVDRSENIVLVDHIAGIISKIDQSGEMLWQLGPSPENFERYNDIVGAFYDVYEDNIIVEGTDKIYVYNLSGEFVSSRQKPAFSFNRMAIIGKDEILYSCQGRNNSHALDQSKQLVWTKAGEVKGVFIEPLSFAPRGLVIGGWQEFSRLNGSLIYHAPLRDTFFEVSLPQVSPAFTFNSGGAIKAEDVMKDGKIRNKLRYMRENGIPVLSKLAADEKIIAIRYNVGSENYFGVLDRITNKWKINNKYLRYEGITIPAPYSYFNGYFFRMVPQYQVDHFGLIPTDAKEVSGKWLDELGSLDNAHDETGSVTMYLLKL